MARILIAGVDRHWMQRQVLEDLRRSVVEAGHEAAEGATVQDVRDADAVIAVMDDADTTTAGLAAAGMALGKPVLSLASTDIPAIAAGSHEAVGDGEAWLAALPGFFDAVRPFAGRLVRDQIPELVKAAGHEVAFRQLTADEKPRFLKQKIQTEAGELMSADVGGEKEELADILEALETFIAARGFDRDDLRRIKEHKRKQRGGFQRCFVVEATSGAKNAPEPEPEPDAPAATTDPDESLAAEKTVRGQFFEI